MITFEAVLKKLGNQGEKTGWIYISIPAEIAQEIKPNNRKTFKVKGGLDKLVIEKVSILPIVEIGFILAVNAAMRKELNKKEGDTIVVSIEEDDDIEKLSQTLLDSINNAPEAVEYFTKLPPSHKVAYSNWVKSAKSEFVIANRIASVIKACTLKMSYSDMMKANKEGKL
jgi:Domain of unknown function (DUF1905)